MPDRHDRTDKMQTSYLNNPPAQPMPERTTGDLDGVVPWVIEFRIVGTPDMIKAPTSDKMVIGRSDSNRNVYPDIDLGPYQAQKQGVSRLHARLIARDNRITIEDLGSSNGTFINNQYLKPYVPYRVRESDVLRLGRLELQVHFIIKPSVNEATMIGAQNTISVPQIGSGQTVLILDDNEGVGRLFREIVSRAGFKALVAQNKAAAIAQLDDAAPDGLITELVLPDGSGLDIVRYVRRHARLSQIPILAITEATGGYQMGQALEEGANHYLGKPVAVDELLDALRHMLRRMDENTA